MNILYLPLKKLIERDTLIKILPTTLRSGDCFACKKKVLDSGFRRNDGSGVPMRKSRRGIVAFKFGYLFVLFSSVFTLHFFLLPVAYSDNLTESSPQIVNRDPVKNEIKVIFTYRSQLNPKNVFIAGTFNNWAENQSGVVRNNEYLMKKDPSSGLWVSAMDLKPKRYTYKFVEETEGGEFKWFPDPFVKERDNDDNSVVDFKSSKSVISPPAVPLQFSKVPEKVAPIPQKKDHLIPKRAFFLQNEKVCFEADSSVSVKNPLLRISDTLGNPVYESAIVLDKSKELCSERPLAPGSYIIQIWKKENSPSAGKDPAMTLLSEEVTSVVDHPAEDVRYGFYADWNKVSPKEDYFAKSKRFLRAHINAVQFYDWFPAHGDYTPDADVYEFDPFYGKKIFAPDIHGKIDGLHRFHILSLAYVAPYAASKSVYSKFPYPMRYEDGNVRVFSSGGNQESDISARKNGRDIWFYLMSVHSDSPWRKHILEELTGAIKFGFDGFHVDSYGHGDAEKYYGFVKSDWDGKKMADVLALMVGSIRKETQKEKKPSMVAFNSVSGFALKEMCDKEDFAFIENWAGHSSHLEELAEMTFAGSCGTGQRMVIALYPKDSEEKPDVWDEETLRLILGATQSGGGSLIVLGEPQGDSFNSLSDLYYPNFKPLPDSSLQVIHDFYHFDQLMYGYTHGKDIKREALPSLPYDGILSFGFENRSTKVRSYTLYRTGSNRQWTKKSNIVEPVDDVVMGFPGKATRAFYATPENQNFRNPVEVPLSFDGQNSWVRISQIKIFGAVILIP